jgi:hypothetical protein
MNVAMMNGDGKGSLLLETKNQQNAAIKNRQTSRAALLIIFSPFFILAF